MNITIEIKAPELAHAIEALAAALSGSQALLIEGVLKNKILKEKDQVKQEDKKAEQPKPEPEKEEVTDAKEEEGEAPQIKIETVRSTLAKLSQAGKQAQVKKIITEIGKAKKLTEIEPSLFAEVLAAAEEIA